LILLDLGVEIHHLFNVLVLFNILVYRTLVEYDKESLMINEPLAKSLFHIEIPKNAGIRLPSGVVVEQEQNRATRGKIYIIILAMVIFLCCAVLFIWRQYQHRQVLGT